MHRPARPHRSTGLVLAVALVGGLGGVATYLHAARILPRASSIAAPAAPAVAGPEGLPNPSGDAVPKAPPPFVGTELATWVLAENAKPGTRDWQLTRPATAHQIEGYASAVSVEAGSSVDLYVSTEAPTFRVDAFRMGYYGGTEGRRVWSSDQVGGIRQPGCSTAPVTHMVSCDWRNPLPIATGGWPEGDYLLELTASTGYESYVPLTVRDDSSHSAYLVNNSVTTWQAYNLFGDYNLYQGPNRHGGAALADRALEVSFDRPYQLGNGAGDFVGLELPMVATMESLGLDVSYTTDVDLSVQPRVVTQHRAFVSLGHDEYYSLSMRQGLRAARDAGVNLVFLGANAVYRHIRLSPSLLGPDRQEIDYKNARLDPLLGQNDQDVTPFAWRDWPNNAPESALVGEMWQCNPVHADMVITEPDSWLFSGTGLGPGSHIPGIVGPEYDHFDPYAPNPGNVSVVARSPVRCDHSWQEADMTYYAAPSGGGVWDTGTIDWVGSVLPYCSRCSPADPVTAITANVLAAFGAGPAGAVHPSVANVGGTSYAPATTTTVTIPTGSTTTSVPEGKS